MPLLDEDDQEYSKRKLCLLSNHENTVYYDQLSGTHTRSLNKSDDEFYYYQNEPYNSEFEETLKERSFIKSKTKSKSRNTLDRDDFEATNGYYIFYLFNHRS
jgi:hypothetical protein